MSRRGVSAWRFLLVRQQLVIGADTATTLPHDKTDLPVDIVAYLLLSLNLILGYYHDLCLPVVVASRGLIHFAIRQETCKETTVGCNEENEQATRQLHTPEWEDVKGTDPCPISREKTYIYLFLRIGADETGSKCKEDYSCTEKTTYIFTYISFFLLFAIRHDIERTTR